MKLSFEIKQELVPKEEMLDKLRMVLYRSMIKMQEIAMRKVPVDTGRLKNSIHLDPIVPGHDEYILSDGVEYGIHIEYGTSPHWVPISPLTGWSRRVLGDEKAAYSIRAAIARRGTPAQPFFRPALQEVKSIHLPKIFASVFAQP